MSRNKTALTCIQPCNILTDECSLSCQCTFIIGLIQGQDKAGSYGKTFDTFGGGGGCLFFCCCFFLFFYGLSALFDRDSIYYTHRPRFEELQSNLDSSNYDGSFTMANSNSFLSPYEMLPLAQENKYFGKFSYFIMKLYVVCTH